ncbi:methyl-accepting chemotaxis protein, partial [Variovorax sp. J22R115]|nr:methyl-accepting chemotaxis protein [Variovorax sp. J22R115]
TSGIEQINQAITQMDQVTQQNAALVEEAAAAAASLQEQAGGLLQIVSTFKLDADDGAGPVQVPVRPAPVAVAAPKTGATTAATKPRPKEVPAPKAATASAGDWTEF